MNGDMDLREYIDNMYSKMHSNREIENIIFVPEQYLSYHIYELMISLGQGDREDMSDSESESDDEEPEPIFADYNVNTTSIDNDNTDTLNITQNIIPPFSSYETQNMKQELQLTMIDNCFICSSEHSQKGFKMGCCSNENNVCVNCVIRHQLLEHTKYISLTQVSNMYMFSEPQSCFFCRKENMITQILNDNECKSIFMDIYKEQLHREMLEKEQRAINDLLQNL
jgi:hypothetical protein